MQFLVNKITTVQALLDHLSTAEGEQFRRFYVKVEGGRLYIPVPKANLLKFLSDPYTLKASVEWHAEHHRMVGWVLFVTKFTEADPE